MIKYHDIEPVRVVIIIKRNGRSRVDHRFIGIAWIGFIHALSGQNPNVMNPVIVKGGDHNLGGKFNHIPVGNNILKGLVVKLKPCIPGSFFAAFHNFFGMLIYQFHNLSILDLHKLTPFHHEGFENHEISFLMPWIIRVSSASSLITSILIKSLCFVRIFDAFKYFSTSVALDPE